MPVMVDTPSTPHSPAFYRVRTRVAAIIPQGNEILLVSYCFYGEQFWSLPGGAPLAGEPPRQTVQREVWEETGLRVDDLRLLFISDHLYRSGIGIDAGGPGGLYHELGLYFVAFRHSGAIKIGDEPEHGAQHIIRDCRFVALSDIPSLIFYPSHIVQPLIDAGLAGFDIPCRYMENRGMHDHIAPAPRAILSVGACEPIKTETR